MTRVFSLAHLTFNKAALKPRRVTVNGQEWLVCPMSLIVPGVLPGSKGPLFYPPSEVVRNAKEWEGTPIVIDHPYVNGLPASAKTPGVLAQSGVGVLKRPTFNGKLVAEGWFNVRKLRAKAIQVYNALSRGEPVELSTGLFTDNHPAPQGVTYNGRPYTHIARNYRPDHLAILTEGRTGACSLRDGCGVLVNENPTANNCGLGAGGFQPGNSCAKGGEGGGSEGSMDLSKELSFFKGKNPGSHADAKSALAAAGIKSRKQDHTSVIVKGAFDKTGIVKSGWKHEGTNKLDTTSSHVFTKGSKVLKVSEFHHPTLPAEYDASVWNSETPVHNCSGNDTCHKCKEKAKMALDKHQRKAVVDELITDNAAWDEADRTILDSFSDDKLVELHKQHVNNAMVAEEEEAVAEEEEAPAAPVVPKKKAVPPVANSSKLTAEQWYALAPPEVKEMTKMALTINERHKTELVSQIVANADAKTRPALEKKLMGKPLEDLQLMASLLPTANSNVGGSDNPFSPNYVGAAGGPVLNHRLPVGRNGYSNITLNADERKDVMTPPVIDWQEESKIREAALAGK